MPNPQSLIPHPQSPCVRRPVAVDLFAGAGGFSLGLEQAGFDVLVAVESDPIHTCTYAFNFPTTKILCADAANVTAEMIRSAVWQSWEERELGVGSWELGIGETQNPKSKIQNPKSNDAIDLVFGGPPCQGFSMMGKRNLNDDRNNLVFHFYRLVCELKPSYFVMENVPGMAAGEHKIWLQKLQSLFETAGYKLQVGILNAADFGVPQKRRRLFMIGSQHGVMPVSLPAASGMPCPTVRDALVDLPDLEQFPELRSSDEVLLTDAQLLQLNERSSHYVKILRSHSGSTGASHPSLEAGNFSYPRLWNLHLLTSSMQTQHSENLRNRFAQTLPNQMEKISRLRRLDWNGLSHTLRAGTDAKHGSYTSPRPIHPALNRVISVREAARLHSFPDWFRFHQTKWHGFRQVGNAVPPLLARAIGKNIIAALGVTPSMADQELSLGDTQLLRFDSSHAAKYWQ